MRRLLIASILCLVFSLSATAQTTTVMSFDQDMHQHAARIVIGPPAGQTWTLLRGSWSTATAKPGMSLTVFEMNSGTGHETLCPACTNIIRVPLTDYPWVPIIGGYTIAPNGVTLRGQEEPIVLEYPRKLILHVSNLGPGVQFRAFVRFTVKIN